ncbi:hypothetical protein AAIH36_33680, partial [Pseudomonas aeruginosa]|uniref:hypothetical protein n=1 Tax=Pseudomonas aeruginosa TaxID=287 RepID=UPI0031B6F352
RWHRDNPSHLAGNGAVRLGHLLHAGLSSLLACGVDGGDSGSQQAQTAAWTAMFLARGTSSMSITSRSLIF